MRPPASCAIGRRTQYFKLEIAPHPALTPSQKKVVAKDYGMAGGKRVISVRHAMLFYVLKRLNLLRGEMMATSCNPTPGPGVFAIRAMGLATYRSPSPPYP